MVTGGSVAHHWSCRPQLFVRVSLLFRVVLMSVAQEKAGEPGKHHLFYPRIWSRHCLCLCSLPLCEAVKADWRQNSASSHQITSHPNRDLIPIKHCTPSHFLHYLVHAMKLRLALCFYAEFIPAAEGQVVPGPTWSLHVQSGKYFFSPWVNIWIIRTSLHQLSVFSCRCWMWTREEISRHCESKL